MEDNKKYLISLDNIDISYLPLRRLFDGNDCDTVPIWSVTNKDKNSDEFYEFQLFAEEKNDTISESDENNSVEQCYICDTSVPTTYIQNHYESDKHRTCAAIIRHALLRATRHAQSVPLRHTESATQPVPLAYASGDVAYFCDHCSLVVKLKNKDAHEKTKEHQVSVIHDRLLNGLLITYLDKDKIVADSRYEDKATDASVDSTVEEYLNEDDIAKKFANETDITDDELSSCTSDHDKGKESNLDEDSDGQSIIFRDDHQENEDVANASYLILCDETIELCDENWNTQLSKSLTNQTKDNHKDTVSSVEQDTVEIRSIKGLTVKVSTNNYHGFVNTWAAWPEKGNCLICQKVSVDTDKHKLEPHHIELISKPVWDLNCIRQINEVWYHCIICNKMVQNKELHVSTKSHKDKLHPLGLTRKQLKFQKKAENEFYCDMCKCSMSIEVKELHLNSARHAATLLGTINSAENGVLHYHFKKFKGDILCIICNVLVLDDDIDKHLESNAHDVSYKSFLLKNQITIFNKSFWCHACNYRYKQNNMHETDHVKSAMHKLKLSLYKPKSTKPVNLHSIEDIEYLDFATIKLLYFFELSDEPEKVKCKVCKNNIESKSALIKKHLAKEYHKFNIEALLLVNKIKIKLNGLYFCEVCHSTINVGKEINHINSDHHKQNIIEVQPSLSWREKDNNTTDNTKDNNHKRNVRTSPLSWRKKEDNISNLTSNAYVLNGNTVKTLATKPTVSSASNLTSNAYVLDGNTVEKLATKATMKRNECADETVKPSNSLKFNQLLQMNKLSLIENGEYFCDLCAIPVATKNIMEHVQCKSHLEKLVENSNEKDKSISQYYCEACQTYITNIYYVIDIHNRSEQHRLNLKHLQKDKKNNIEEYKLKTDFGYMFEPDDNWRSVNCKVCQHSLRNSKSKILRHMESSKHLNSLNLLFTKNKLQIQFSGKYFCEFCNDNVELMETLNHIHSEKHKNNTKAEKEITINFKKSYAEQEIIAAEKEVSVINLEKLQLDKNQPLNAIAKLENSVEDNTNILEVNAPSFAATSTINNKATKKYVVNALKNKVDTSSVKVISYKVNSCFDVEEENLQVGSITGSSEVFSKQDMKNCFLEVLSKPEVMCVVCDTVVPKTDINIRDHLRGKRHKANYVNFVEHNKVVTIVDKSSCDINVTVKNPTEQAQTDNSKSLALLKDPIFKYVEGVLFCRCCNTEVTCTDQFINTHLTDWRHKVKSSAMLAENGLRVDKDKIYCDVCEIHLPNLNGITHIDSISHKTKVSAKSVCNTAKMDETKSDNCKNNEKTTERPTSQDSNLLKAKGDKSKSLEAVFCDSCKVNVLNMAVHLKGEHHKSVVKPKVVEKNYTCEICNVKVENKNIKQHENGAPHKNKFKAILLNNNIESRDDNVMFCEFCDLFFTTVSLIKHIEGENHKANCRKLETNKFCSS